MLASFIPLPSIRYGRRILVVDILSWSFASLDIDSHRAGPHYGDGLPLPKLVRRRAPAYSRHSIPCPGVTAYHAHRIMVWPWLYSAEARSQRGTGTGFVSSEIHDIWNVNDPYQSAGSSGFLHIGIETALSVASTNHPARNRQHWMLPIAYYAFSRDQEASQAIM
ncbi:hypothetical protein OG21DRAFT_940636 [Imleria badia]|nr:hypothetical protein OG21DRAFT_940636 [Imleria badia]